MLYFDVYLNATGMNLIVNKKRPINLDLRTLSFPPMAIASILHRVSGILLFLLLPLVLFCLEQSLHSRTTFHHLQEHLASPFFKIPLWIFASALCYHILAGMRHLLMDVGLGEHLKCARTSALLVIGLGVVSTLLIGIWLW
jgi:succinate dehydrogenase / fumarate reductase cytochrome b subunit